MPQSWAMCCSWEKVTLRKYANIDSCLYQYAFAKICIVNLGGGSTRCFLVYFCYLKTKFASKIGIRTKGNFVTAVLKACGVVVRTSDLRSQVRFPAAALHVQPWASCSHTASVHQTANCASWELKQASHATH